VAAAVRTRFPERRVVVWAQDKDLLGISNAPNLVVDRSAAPDFYQQFLVDQEGGTRFARSLRELINFEYHDITTPGDLPPLDLIVARDVLSFLEEAIQRRLLETYLGLLKEGGALVLGDHEEAFVADAQAGENRGLRYFTRTAGAAGRKGNR
jgi:purine-binding chemotaxis protein CheW